MQTSKRKIEEMAEMYELPKELYTMHREIKRDGELRYDITEIPAMIINGHYNKTKGHFHSSGHKELYTILQGTAYFLFQKIKHGIEDFYYIEATKGESVIVPGDYYHITINTGKKTLKLGNWISDECISDYTLIQEKKGMCYYLTTKGWIKNKNYKGIIPSLKTKQPFKEITPEHMLSLK